MGEVYTEITLKNGSDLVLVRNGHLEEKNIRSATVTALVDTGTTTIVIGEKIRKTLGLTVLQTRNVGLPGGKCINCGITEPVQIYWKDRSAIVQAMFLPNEEEILLGIIPLEEMDLIIDPLKQTLIGAHGDIIEKRLYGHIKIREKTNS